LGGNENYCKIENTTCVIKNDVSRILKSIRGVSTNIIHYIVEKIVLNGIADL